MYITKADYLGENMTFFNMGLLPCLLPTTREKKMAVR